MTAKTQFENYNEYLENEANSIIEQYKDEMFDEILEGYTNVREFFCDSKIHEWCDSDFIYADLIDSAHIIEQSDNVETDSGLWEGLEPVEAVKAQAFFTYRFDLERTVESMLLPILEEKLEEYSKEVSKWEEEVKRLSLLIDEDNDSDELEAKSELAQEKLDELQEKYDNIESAIEEL